MATQRSEGDRFGDGYPNSDRIEGHHLGRKAGDDSREDPALFEQSKMTPGDFCRETGLNDATFSLWRRKAREGTGSAESGPQFAEARS